MLVLPLSNIVQRQPSAGMLRFNPALPKPVDVWMPGVTPNSLLRGMAPTTHLGNGTPRGKEQGLGYSNSNVSRKFPSAAHPIAGASRFAWVIYVKSELGAYTDGASLFRHDGAFTAMQATTGARIALWNAWGIQTMYYGNLANDYTANRVHCFAGLYADTMYSYGQGVEVNHSIISPGTPIVAHANPLCFGGTEGNGEAINSNHTLFYYAIWVNNLPTRRQLYELHLAPWKLFAPEIAQFYYADVATAPYIVQNLYRWRNDDGSESAATWAAANNAGIYTTPNNNKRVRVVIDAQNAGSPESFQLDYRQVGDTNWKKVT